MVVPRFCSHDLPGTQVCVRFVLVSVRLQTYVRAWDWRGCEILCVVGNTSVVRTKALSERIAAEEGSKRGYYCATTVPGGPPLRGVSDRTSVVPCIHTECLQRREPLRHQPREGVFSHYIRNPVCRSRVYSSTFFCDRPVPVTFTAACMIRCVLLY